jgi:hypothetical protein
VNEVERSGGDRRSSADTGKRERLGSTCHANTPPDPSSNLHNSFHDQRPDVLNGARYIETQYICDFCQQSTWSNIQVGLLATQVKSWLLRSAS